MRNFINIINENSMSSLKSIRKNMPIQFGDFVDWLNQNGFEQLGSGLFGHVHYVKDNLVIKTWIGDECYKSYVNFCALNRVNVHLPRVGNVYDIKSTKSINNYHAVLLERLYPLNTNDQNDLFVYSGSDAYLSVFYSQFSKDIEDSSEFDAAHDFKQKYPTLAKTLDQIVNHFGSGECKADLSEMNIMKRRNGEYVYSDPIS